MPDKPSPGRDRGRGSRSAALKDAAVQRAILSLVLATHPVCCTIPELAREFGQGDAVERAVRDLVGIGLVECRGVSVRPSAVARYFYRLDLP